jgi:hypothetical protein
MNGEPCHPCTVSRCGSLCQAISGHAV